MGDICNSFNNNKGTVKENKEKIKHLIILKIWKQHKCPTVEELLSIAWYISSMQGEQIPFIPLRWLPCLERQTTNKTATQILLPAFPNNNTVAKIN